MRRVRGVAYAAKVSPQVPNRVVDAAKGLLNQVLPDVAVPLVALLASCPCSPLVLALPALSFGCTWLMAQGRRLMPLHLSCVTSCVASERGHGHRCTYTRTTRREAVRARRPATVNLLSLLFSLPPSQSLFKCWSFGGVACGCLDMVHQDAWMWMWCTKMRPVCMHRKVLHRPRRSTGAGLGR